MGIIFQISQQSNSPSLIIPAAYGSGSLTNVFALPSNNIFNSKSYYTITFTTATTGIISTVEITFPTGFNIASAKLIEVQGLGLGSLSVSGQVLKYTVSSPVSVPPSRAMKLMIADITNAATNPSQVSVVTKYISTNIVVIDGPTSSAPFTLIQVTNPMIGADAIDNSKIKNGQVGLADLASNSVDGSKIVDGSVAKTDVSTAFVKKVSLSYGMQGWNPGLGYTNFHIEDSQVTETSVMQITAIDKYNYGCSIDQLDVGAFDVKCVMAPSLATKLNYAIIN
jgi:hypothetical protein